MIKNTKKYYLGLEGELLEIKNKYPVKIAFIGCGSHAYRNIYPCLQFLPIDLVAVCDLNQQKADLFKKKFGATKEYTDYKKMLAEEKIDGVIVVVGFADDGTPLYLPIVDTILKKGIPVWFEKPPARNAEEVQKMLLTAEKNKTFAQVGFKKMFMPSIEKVRDIIKSKEFGKLTTYTIRYPVDLPEDIRDIEKAGPRRFLDDFVHVASTIITLLGRPDYLIYKRSINGGAIATLIHKEGHVGSLHLCPEASEACPLEQLEIVGEGSNIILNNNIEIAYYNKTKRLPYGRTASFIPSSGQGCQYFVPEFSLGQLYNKGIFLLGYYGELKQFIESVHNKKIPKYASLKDAIAVMELYDAFANKEMNLTEIGSPTIRKNVLLKSAHDNKTPLCPNCNTKMILKDGWNYSCKKCGRMTASSELD
jgi:predicted dehydrogenase